MASQRDRDHMARIAAFMDELNRQAIADAARQDPGEKILIGLRLGSLALAAAQHEVPHEEELPPVRIWRALKARKASE